MEFYAFAAAAAGLVYFFGRNPLDPNSGHNVGDPGFGNAPYNPPDPSKDPNPLPGPSNPADCKPIPPVCQYAHSPSGGQDQDYSWVPYSNIQYEDDCQKISGMYGATRWIAFSPVVGWWASTFTVPPSQMGSWPNLQTFLANNTDTSSIPWPPNCSPN